MNQLLRHVSVVGLQSVVVTDDDVLTIAATFVAYYTYTAVKGSTDGIANINLNVQTLVLASPT